MTNDRLKWKGPGVILGVLSFSFAPEAGAVDPICGVSDYPQKVRALLLENNAIHRTHLAGWLEETGKKLVSSSVDEQLEAIQRIEKARPAFDEEIVLMLTDGSGSVHYGSADLIRLDRYEKQISRPLEMLANYAAKARDPALQMRAVKAFQSYWNRNALPSMQWRMRYGVRTKDTALFFDEGKRIAGKIIGNRKISDEVRRYLKSDVVLSEGSAEFRSTADLLADGKLRVQRGREIIRQERELKAVQKIVADKQLEGYERISQQTKSTRRSGETLEGYAKRSGFRNLQKDFEGGPLGQGNLFKPIEGRYAGREILFEFEPQLMPLEGSGQLWKVEEAGRSFEMRGMIVGESELGLKIRDLNGKEHLFDRPFYGFKHVYVRDVISTKTSQSFGEAQSLVGALERKLYTGGNAGKSEVIDQVAKLKFDTRSWFPGNESTMWPVNGAGDVHGAPKEMMKNILLTSDDPVLQYKALDALEAWGKNNGYPVRYELSMLTENPKLSETLRKEVFDRLQKYPNLKDYDQVYLPREKIVDFRGGSSLKKAAATYGPESKKLRLQVGSTNLESYATKRGYEKIDPSYLHSKKFARDFDESLRKDFRFYDDHDRLWVDFEDLNGKRYWIEGEIDAYSGADRIILKNSDGREFSIDPGQMKIKQAYIQKKPAQPGNPYLDWPTVSGVRTAGMTPWTQLEELAKREMDLVLGSGPQSEKLEAIRRLGATVPDFGNRPGQVIEGLTKKTYEKMAPAALAPYDTLSKIIRRTRDPELQMAALEAMRKYELAVAPRYNSVARYSPEYYADLYSLGALPDSVRRKAFEYGKAGNGQAYIFPADRVFQTSDELLLQRHGKIRNFSAWKAQYSKSVDRQIASMRISSSKIQAKLGEKPLSTYATEQGFSKQELLNFRDRPIEVSQDLLGEEVLVHYQVKRMKMPDGRGYPLAKMQDAKLQGTVIEESRQSFVIRDADGRTHRIDFESSMASDGNLLELYRKPVKHLDAGSSHGKMKSTLLAIEKDLYGKGGPPSLAAQRKAVKQLKAIQPNRAGWYDNRALKIAYLSQQNLDMLYDIAVTSSDLTLQKQAIAALIENVKASSAGFDSFSYGLGQKILYSPHLDESLRRQVYDFMRDYVKKNPDAYDWAGDVAPRSSADLKNYLSETYGGESMNKRFHAIADRFEPKLEGQSLEQYAAKNGYTRLPDHYVETTRFEAALEKNGQSYSNPGTEKDWLLFEMRGVDGKTRVLEGQIRYVSNDHFSISLPNGGEENIFFHPNPMEFVRTYVKPSTTKPRFFDDRFNPFDPNQGSFDFAPKAPKSAR